MSLNCYKCGRDVETVPHITTDLGDHICQSCLTPSCPKCGMVETHCRCANPTSEGIELRDLFACFAMLNIHYGPAKTPTFDIIASFSYAIADEMLKARKKNIEQ